MPRKKSRWYTTQAASDNVTHGSWILAAVALGVLSVGALAIPGGPVHHWLNCNIGSMADINGTSATVAKCGAKASATVPTVQGTVVTISSYYDTNYPSTPYVYGTPVNAVNAKNPGVIWDFANAVPVGSYLNVAVSIINEPGLVEVENKTGSSAIDSISQSDFKDGYYEFSVPAQSFQETNIDIWNTFAVLTFKGPPTLGYSATPAYSVLPAYP